MYKTIRKSVAEVITTVENPEQFQWNRWLREPQIYLERFAKPRIEIKKIDSFSKFEQPALYQVRRFSLSKFKVSEEIKNVLIKKRKTFKVFITFPKTIHHEVKILRNESVTIQHLLTVYWKKNEFFIRYRCCNKDTIYNINPRTIHHNIDISNSTIGDNLTVLVQAATVTRDLSISKTEIFDCILIPLEKLSSPIVRNYNVLHNVRSKKLGCTNFILLDKKPRIKEIPLVNLDDLKQDYKRNGNKPVKEIILESLLPKPRLYKAKVNQIEKNKLSLYQVNNLQIPNTTPKVFNCVTIDKPAIFKHTLTAVDFVIPEISDHGLMSLGIDNEDDSSNRFSTIEILKTAADEIVQIDTEQSNKINVSESNLEFNGQQPITNNDNSDELIPHHLLPYQKDGIRYLLNRTAAIISAELGLDKKQQAIHALSIKIKQGKIKSALIVSPSFNIGDKKLNQFISNLDGWENLIHEHYPELKFQTFTSDCSDKFQEDVHSDILIFDYTSFFNWISNESNASSKKNFSCIIYDEAQYLLSDQSKFESLTNLPHSYNKWLLTSSPNQVCKEHIIPKLKNHVPEFENLEELLCCTKSIVSDEMPSVKRNDFWLNMDRDQTQEFENILLLGQKRIFDLVKGGNPFLIQSNIFTLIHQIKQLSNFSSLKDHSPKSELLLEHLDSIISSRQKAIIFSQYDKQGIQKIELLLKKQNIRYVLYQAGMPIKELENSASMFRRDSHISVMLTGLTSANLKVRIPEAPYIIHFDQWWNPIVQWHFEDKTLSSDDPSKSHEFVNVFNYFGNNSVEIKIREALLKRGLLTKNLVEFLSNEAVYSLITNEDWLDILEIENTRSLNNELPDLDDLSNKLHKNSIEEIGQKTKLLFTKLGYKNLLLKPDAANDTVTIYGSASKNLQEIKIAIRCTPFTLKEYDSVVKYTNEAIKINNKVFLVCSDEIADHLNKVREEKVICIGQRMFSNYVSLFKIS